MSRRRLSLSSVVRWALSLGSFRPHATRGVAAYTFAAAVSVASLAVTFAIRPALTDGVYFPPAVAAVVLSAWVGGFGAGVLSAALLMAGTAHLMLAPVGAPAAVNSASEMRLLIFAATALGLSALAEAHGQSVRRHHEVVLRETNQQLSEADRRKNQFIAVLAHELRNPLASIRYGLPIVDGEALGPMARRTVGVIGREVDHLVRLVDDLLDVGRIARGEIELRREPVVLDSVLAAVVDAVPRAVVAKQHHLKTSMPAEAIVLDADPARLKQVFTNLLDNAAKYTPAGGTIRLDAARHGEHAVVRVRDNGIGIAADALPYVFEMFRQIDRSPDAQSGLGIGLALAKWLVEMQGGSIEAHSGGLGHGAEFVVRLPVSKSATVPVPRKQMGIACADGSTVV